MLPVLPTDEFGGGVGVLLAGGVVSDGPAGLDVLPHPEVARKAANRNTTQ
jgi:hypothetical protein